MATVLLTTHTLTQEALPSRDRPWQSAIDPLSGSVSELLRFPTDEEADGLVQILWRGPAAVVSHTPFFVV